MSDLRERLRTQETTYEPIERRVHGLTVNDIIYNIIDHNSIIALWEDDHQDTHYSMRLWKGEGWRIPECFKYRKFKRIFSSVPDSVVEGDVINIDIYWD